jgi:hypothetical protein
MSRQSQVAGFTLFEVIVVLVITGLISVVLVQGLGLILGVRTTVLDKIIGLERIVIERNVVLDPLRGVAPDYPERPYVFAGTSQRIRGLTLRGLRERPGTPTGFTMMLDYDATRRAIVLTYEEQGHKPFELASWSGVEAEFSYRDRTGDWTDRWPINTDVSQTPWLIRIQAGDGGASTLIASISGSHRRAIRMLDSPIR